MPICQVQISLAADLLENQCRVRPNGAPLLQHDGPTRQPRRPVWLGRAGRRDLQSSVSVITAHGEFMLAWPERPIVAPRHPGQLGQRRPYQSLFPRTIVHLHLDLRYSAIASMRHSANRNQLALVGANDGHIDRHRVDDRGRVHLRHLVPASHHPEARLPMIRELNRLNPFGLFHSVYVWNIDPKRETMLTPQRHTIPRVCQHDPFVRFDRIECDHFEKLVCRSNLQMCRCRLQPEIWQQPL